MPKYRVNVRAVEHWVYQYEIIADDPDKARALVPILLEMNGADALPKRGEEQVGPPIYNDPDTYSVAEAGPLEEMEKAEAANNRYWLEHHRKLSAMQEATSTDEVEIVMLPSPDPNKIVESN